VYRQGHSSGMYSCDLRHRARGELFQGGQRESGRNDVGGCVEGIVFLLVGIEDVLGECS